MFFIARVTDWHFGGHVSFVRVLPDDEYSLTSDEKSATHFTSYSQFAIIRDKLGIGKNRTVDYEFVVDHQLMTKLSDL